MLLAKMIRVACADEKEMRTYLGKIEYIKDVYKRQGLGDGGIQTMQENIVVFIVAQVLGEAHRKHPTRCV